MPTRSNTVFVWPIPRHKDGRAPSISSGFRTSSRPTHQGVDLFYRRPKCGAQKLPTMSKCYEMPGDVPVGRRGSMLYVPNGVPMLAYGPGVVTTSKMQPKGDYIVIEHPLGWTSQYMHMAKRLVKVGDRVSAGQKIGIVGHGKTAYNMAKGYALNHPHFQLRYNGQLVDPRGYLKNARIMPWSPTLSALSSPLIYVGIAAAVVGGYWYWKRRRR